MKRWDNMPVNAIRALAKRGPPQIKKAAKEYLGIRDESSFQQEFCRYLHNEAKWQKEVIIPEVREIRTRDGNMSLNADILAINSKNEITAYEIKKGNNTSYQNFYTGLGEAIKNCEFSKYSYLVYFNEDTTKGKAVQLRKIVKKYTNSVGLLVYSGFQRGNPVSLSELQSKKNKINGLKTLARKIKNEPDIVFWHYNKCCKGCVNAKSCSTMKKFGTTQ